MVLKIGDTVALRDVSDGMMVRIEADFCVRIRGRGLFVFLRNKGTWLAADEFDDAAKWEWCWPGNEARLPATVAALDLIGQESARELQRLAEIFEIYEDIFGALVRADKGSLETRDGYFAAVIVGHAAAACGEDEQAAAHDLAARLHAAGGRRGIESDEAARLLAR